MGMIGSGGPLNERVVMLPSLPESYIGTKVSDFRWTPMFTLNAAEMGIFQRMAKRTLTSSPVCVP